MRGWGGVRADRPVRASVPLGPSYQHGRRSVTSYQGRKPIGEIISLGDVLEAPKRPTDARFHLALATTRTRHTSHSAALGRAHPPARRTRRPSLVASPPDDTRAHARPGIFFPGPTARRRHLSTAAVVSAPRRFSLFFFFRLSFAARHRDGDHSDELGGRVAADTHAEAVQCLQR